MKWLQTLFAFIFGIFLLVYLWPLLLIFLAIIGYQLYKATTIFKKAYQEEAHPESQNNYETFKQDASNDVIDANYTERSDKDGPQ